MCVQNRLPMDVSATCPAHCLPRSPPYWEIGDHAKEMWSHLYMSWCPHRLSRSHKNLWDSCEEGLSCVLEHGSSVFFKIHSGTAVVGTMPSWNGMIGGSVIRISLSFPLSAGWEVIVSKYISEIEISEIPILFLPSWLFHGFLFCGPLYLDVKATTLDSAFPLVWKIQTPDIKRGNCKYDPVSFATYFFTQASSVSFSRVLFPSWVPFL